VNTVSKTVSLLLVVCFFLCGCSEREDTLKIGFMIDERVAYNQDAVAAARMLVDELNTGGGIKVGEPNLQARFFRIKNHEIIEVEAKLR